MKLSPLLPLSSAGLLAPPIFPGDDERTLRARLVNSALLANLALVAFCVAAGFVGGRVPPRVLALEIAFAALTIVLLAALRRGHVRMAAAALLVKGFVATTMAITQLGTIRAPVAGFYLALVMATGILFDRRAMAVMIGLCSLAIGGLILAENAGWLPRPDYTVNITQWAVSSVLLLCVGFWVTWALDTVRAAWRRAEREVAERLRAEEALKLSEFSVQQASVGTLWIAPDARILRVNRAVCDMFGYTEAELLARTVPDLDPAFPAERWPAHWEELRARRRFSFETWSRHQSGRLFPAEVEINWIEFGGQEYNFAFIRDVSATRALERQLRQAQKLEAVGTFAGGIAHDFNNILAGIYGYTTLARQVAGPQPELHGYLDEIARGGRRAADLVRQILDFSRRPGDDEAMGPVSVERVLAEAAQLLRAVSPSTIDFHREITPGLPPVLGNTTQLHQVVMNLGTNALQAMGPGPGRLTLGLRAVTVEAGGTTPPLDGVAGPCLCLTVADTGPGMDAVTQERAFEPFFTTKHPGVGTGLGLSVVHGVVRRHRGAVRLVSAPGVGTTFEVFLPVVAAAPAPDATAPAAPAANQHGRGERVLLLDDEPAVADSGRRLLEDLGYRVTAFTDPRDALLHAAHDPRALDVVVSDQTMPTMSGLEFARRLHLMRADLPVLLVSGHSDALTAENLRRAGVAEVLAKPYTTAELAAALRRRLAEVPAAEA